MRVVTERVPGALSVAAGVWVGVGARDEPQELSGVSHFLEHLLFKGTEDAQRAASSPAGDRSRRGRHERLHQPRSTRPTTAVSRPIGWPSRSTIMSDVLDPPRAA